MNTTQKTKTHNGNIDWDDLYKKYKEWYMTKPRSWQQTVNVFKCMKKQIQNDEQENSKT